MSENIFGSGGERSMRERKNEKTTGTDEEGAVVLTDSRPSWRGAPHPDSRVAWPGARRSRSTVLRASRQPLLAADGAAVSGGDGLVSRLPTMRRGSKDSGGRRCALGHDRLVRAGGKPRQQHPEHDAQRRGGSSEVASDDRDGGSQRLKECGGLEAACAAGGALGAARPSRSRASLDESRERAPAAR